jgi:hypothetical protein
MFMLAWLMRDDAGSYHECTSLIYHHNLRLFKAHHICQIPIFNALLYASIHPLLEFPDA